MALAYAHADAFEVRLDLLRVTDLSRLFSFARRPVVATCRPAREGGGFRGSERSRKQLLDVASALGAAFVDVEWSAGKEFLREFLQRREECGVIVSHHLTPGEKSMQAEWYRRLVATGADVVKYAYHAADLADCATAFDFLARARRDRRRAIAIGMGVHGELTRILYRKFGGWATYASADIGPAAAPGQIPARTLKEVFRAHRLTPATRVFGVLGNPVAQSKGYFMHNAHFEHCGANAVYCRFPVTDLDRFMKRLMPLFHGCSVTLPYKQAIMQYADVVEPRAAAMGAVNTLIRTRAGLRALNTDAPAALDAIERYLKVRGRRFLVLGAGGAARAVVFEAVRRGAVVVIANRTAEKAEALAHEAGASVVPWRTAHRDAAEVVVNTTPVGMVPRVGRTPLTEVPSRARVILDAVYNPPETRFLRQARKRGMRTISGVEWYLNQAIEQARLYSGTAPRRAFLARVLGRHLEIR
jgi:3-dehydroquinate dehydratase/shikimate dehydrogenase